MAKQPVVQKPLLEKKNPESKVAFVNGKWVEINPAEATKIQKSHDEKRAAALLRHVRLGKNRCPECDAPTPKHERLRACTVNCTKCGHLYMTYPGV